MVFKMVSFGQSFWRTAHVSTKCLSDKEVLVDLLDRVIVLLYRAHFSRNSLIASLDKTIDTSLESIVNKKWSEEYSTKPLTRQLSKQEAVPTSPSFIKNKVNIWWQPSTFWRKDEIDLATNNVLRYIVRPSFSSIFSSTYNTFSIHESEVIPTHNRVDEAALSEPFLDPSFLLSHQEISRVEEIFHAKRKGFRIFTTPRPERYMYTDEFWVSADSYEFIVDATLGLLLYYAALVDNHIFASVSVSSLKFDQPISESIQNPSVPENVRMIYLNKPSGILAAFLL